MRREDREATPPIQMRDEEDNLLALGWLLNIDSRGAQVDLETPLEIGRRLKLVTQETGRLVIRKAEVRWVSRVGGRYHHGLSFT